MIITGLFAALRAIYGPFSNVVAPVNSANGRVLVTDLKDITRCWKEYFSNLLNQQGTTDERATSQMCVHTPKNDLCIPITMEDLEKALEETRRGKAPGLDGISSEILKLGGPRLKARLLSLYNTCWQRQTLPQDFKDTLIVKIYKGKGNRRNCDNHQGISLLSIVGRVLAKIMLKQTEDHFQTTTPRNSMWLPCWQVHCQHDIYSQTTAGKSHGTTKVSLYCLHGFFLKPSTLSTGGHFGRSSKLMAVLSHLSI